jgi:hypothetical protein
MGCNGVHQESAAFNRGRGGAEIFAGGGETGAGRRIAERRALHGGWDTDRGLGEPPELRGEERPAATRYRSAGTQAVARYARVENRF